MLFFFLFSFFTFLPLSYYYDERLEELIILNEKEQVTITGQVHIISGQGMHSTARESKDFDGCAIKIYYNC